MILDKIEDLIPLDAPPTYEQLTINTSSGSQDSKAVQPWNSYSETQRSPGPSTPRTFPSKPSSPSAIPVAKGKSPVTPTSWFSFGASRTTREVKSTVLSLVRDLVRQYPSDSSAAPGILASCAESCTNHSLALSTILQEKFIEEHTPIYWAIIKRQPDSAPGSKNDDLPDLLSALLSYSSPLTPETISEIRVACLLISDQPLFQRLRMSPEFSPLSGSDQMLLDATTPADEITVMDLAGDEGAFAAEFTIVHFQKRMSVSKQIVLEFIARSRLWRLAFSVAPASRRSSHILPGTWCVSLSLLEDSSPTWVDSRLVIDEPRATPMIPSTPVNPLPASTSSLGAVGDQTIRLTSNIGLNFGRGPKPKPSIVLGLHTTSQLAPTSVLRRSSDVVDHITVALDQSLMGSSLQFVGSSYISPDETLRARLEARLSKPQGDCVIC